MHGSEVEGESYAEMEIRRDNALIIRRLDEIAAHVTTLSATTERLALGFPGDDPAGHRAYHEAVIRRIEARAAFWQKLTFELVKYGVLGFLGWSAFALWQAFLRGPK